jgi:hypothetical protein
MIYDLISSSHPAHLENLYKSGLSNKTILEADIKSVSPRDITKKLGFDIPGLSSMYEIPYPCDEEYSRFKAFYADSERYYKDGSEKPKYLARKDSGNHLYIPHKVTPILKDVSIPLYITEGEKKTLKAAQEGINCIGLSGLWNWGKKLNDGAYELLPDFDQIAIEGRTVYLVPDSDWLEPNREGKPKNLKQAVFALAYLLIDKGATVSWVELPRTGEEKVGLDDYLCSHTVGDFGKLPAHKIRKLTTEEAIEDLSKDTPVDEIKPILKRIAGIKNESEKSLLINRIHDKTGLSKRAIQKDISTIRKENMHDDTLQTTISANFQRLVDLVTDKDNKVAYLVKTEDSLEVATVWKVEGKLYSPPDSAHLPFALPNASNVIKWYETDIDQKLFEDILLYLKRFSYLPNNQWLLVVWEVFLTYMQDHPDIHYLPMILFFAVPERGKSRTGKAVIYISYRGIHIVDLREANLFRFSENLKATLFFDLMDLWKKAEKNGAEDILLLRYEKGAQASRVIYPEKGAFNDMVFYDVYGSTLIATNEPVHKILGSRCINIPMPNKPDNYENPTPEKAQELKERLTAWRARVMNKPLPEVNIIQGLNGRLWDISRPLLQVCKLVYPQGFDELKDALLEVAGQRIEDKKESIEGQIISILHTLSPKGLPEWKTKTSEVLCELNKDRPDNHKLTSQYVGRKLKAMGLQTKITRGFSQIFLDSQDFNTLLEQYGMCEITLPLSTILTSVTESRESVGRELVESAGNSTETLPPESLQNQGKVRKVESGRECSGAGEEILEVEYVEVISNV